MKQSRTNQMPRSAETSSNRLNLNFHIGRLTLTGLSQINQQSVVDAMQRRLSALAMQMPDLNWSHISSPFKINGGEISSDATSQQVGDHLAKQIMQHIVSMKTPQKHSP
jgi:hypothetical protein